MFASFKSFLSNLKAQAKSLVAVAEKHMDKDVFAACMAGTVICGWADGDFSSSEKLKALKLAKTHPMFKNKFSADDVKDAFELYDDVMTMDSAMGKAEAMKAITKIANKDVEARELVVQTMAMIGAADGDYDDFEKAVTREVCQALGLRANKFGL
jgi:tellurite resistance protein